MDSNDALYDTTKSDSVDSVNEPRSFKPSTDDSRMASILELLNQRWTASILRSLLNGNTRFNAISREHGINPNTLQVRLRDLEEEGLIIRQEESKNPPKVSYSLSEKGSELAHIFTQIQNWIANYGEAQEAMQPATVREPVESYEMDETELR